MNCPYCNADDYFLDKQYYKGVRLGKYEYYKPSCQYFCMNCGNYFYWVLGERLRISWWEENKSILDFDNN